MKPVRHLSGLPAEQFEEFVLFYKLGVIESPEDLKKDFFEELRNGGVRPVAWVQANLPIASPLVCLSLNVPVCVPDAVLLSGQIVLALKKEFAEEIAKPKQRKSLLGFFKNFFHRNRQ